MQWLEAEVSAVCGFVEEIVGTCLAALFFLLSPSLSLSLSCSPSSVGQATAHF